METALIILAIGFSLFLFIVAVGLSVKWAADSDQSEKKPSLSERPTWGTTTTYTIQYPKKEEDGTKQDNR